MKKNLLISSLLMLISLSAFSTNLDLSLTDLNTGWGSSYNATSKTITFDDAWKGRGWWLNGVDYSAYNDVVVNYVATTLKVKLVVEYMDNLSNTPDVYANAGLSTIKVILDPAKSNAVKQIYMQTDAAGPLVLVSAYLESISTGIQNALISKIYYSDNTIYTEKNADVQVFDLGGLLLVSSKNVSEVSIANLNKGIYIVKANVNGQTQVVKVVR